MRESDGFHAHKMAATCFSCKIQEPDHPNFLSRKIANKSLACYVQCDKFSGIRFQLHRLPHMEQANVTQEQETLKLLQVNGLMRSKELVAQPDHAAGQ